MFSQSFVCFLGARVAFSLAASVLSVAIGWHLYQATGDPFDLALVGLMQILPIMLLFIITGWVVDHFPRKWVLLACASLQLLVFLGLAVSLTGGEVDRVVIFGLLFLNGCARAFFGPALQAVLPNIVHREHLSRAVALTSTVWNGAMTAGPFVGGLLLAQLDFASYWVLVGLAVVSLTLLLPLPELRVEQSSQRGSRELLQGVRFVLGNPYVLPSISLDMFIVLLGSVVALLPVFAADVLGLGPEALGLLRAMPALGAVAAGAVMARLPDGRRVGRRLFVALLVFAVSILIFALSTSLWLSLAALFVYGASDMVSVNLRSTLIQLATPDSLRGRVGAVNSLFIATSNDLGDFRAGAVAAAVGAVPAAVVGAGCAVIVTLVGWKVSPKLQCLDRLSDADVEAAPVSDEDLVGSHRGQRSRG
ncbi:MFS transporter [Spongiibacter taiwanensis]|uniref:MFS transporter n=1 Tax=Spongiibacter taiwanensis TaxID=1748242 RepID=UPI0020364F3D|nr:MFS transporter [Spongiibacter taiwanensis]USA42208.1 MFS transporter [Spongiibacter taiwanensis]